jgi:hypothetical protein
MHSPDQEAPEEKIQQPADGTPEQQEFQPLYEFPATPETVAEYAPANEAAQQGFVYPPPPSFYEKMAVPAQQVPMPGSAGNSFIPTSMPQRPIPGGLAPYPPPVVPPAALQPPVKKSNKWVWIVVSIVSVVILASCGLCSWGFYNFFVPTYRQISGSIDVVNDYYTNLQARNYQAAYRDLAPQAQISNLTEDQFTKQAEERDKNFGPVASFVLNQPSFRIDSQTGPDLSHCTITVDLKRSRLSYKAQLALSKIGNNWKIVAYDHI